MYNLQESISLFDMLETSRYYYKDTFELALPRGYAPSSAFSELIALKSIGEKVEKGIGEAGSLAGSSPFLTCN
jgi:hypothetical protein